MSFPTAVFVDASFFTAILNRRDTFHLRALAWQSSLPPTTRWYTTELALWEFLNTYAAAPYRKLAINAYAQVRQDPRFKIIEVTPQEMESAIKLYTSRPDKEWGVMDCFSFIIMQRLGLSVALTADHHFEQAGFVALLLRDP